MAKRSSKKKFVVWLMTGMLLGLTGSYLFMPEGCVDSFASYITYPILLVQHRYIEPLKQTLAHKRERFELEQLVTQLQQEKDQLNSHIAQLQATLGYADEVKELVDFKKRYACQHAVLSQVLIKNISDQSHFMLIDAGSNKGIQKDMVAVWQNMLVGRVVEVYANYSKVVLVTDRLCKVAAYCSSTKASGIHAGLNQGAATTLNHVSHLMCVQDGDLVLSSGDGLIFPRGFALGRIKTSAVNGLLYDVNVEPLVDMHTINHCYILQKGTEFCLTDTMVTTTAEMAAKKTASLYKDLVATATVNNEPSEYRGVDRHRQCTEHMG